MNAICLVVDRLHAGCVGAYGNAWIETPSMNRLAARSFVLDHALVDSPDLERLYRSYWQGWHAMCRREPPQSRPSLPALLRDAGVKTVLLCDEPSVAGLPAAADFKRRIEIDPPWMSAFQTPQPAEEIEQTHFGRCFVEIIRWLSSARGPFLLWCHLGGLGTIWDAPPMFRRAYQESDDPAPADGVDVPNLELPPDADPDLLLGITQAYSGQVTLFDACLGVLLDFLDESPLGEETLIALTSARGFPLGEHGRVAPAMMRFTASWSTCLGCCGCPARPIPPDAARRRSNRPIFGRRFWTTGACRIRRTRRRPKISCDWSAAKPRCSAIGCASSAATDVEPSARCLVSPNGRAAAIVRQAGGSLGGERRGDAVPGGCRVPRRRDRAIRVDVAGRSDFRFAAVGRRVAARVGLGISDGCRTPARTPAIGKRRVHALRANCLRFHNLYFQGT